MSFFSAPEQSINNIKFKNKIRETNVEGYLKRKVEQNGGMSLKWVSPGFRGVMDRIILWPGHPAEFVETKAPGKEASKRQEFVRKQFQAMGYKCHLLDTKEKVNDYINLKKLL